MRLHLFIEQSIDKILDEWVSFARTLDSAAEEMTLLQLRDHARGILQSIASDIERGQTDSEQYEKSRGLSPREGSTSSAASIHGTQRHQQNFTPLQLSSEFRALRATVLRLWLPHIVTLSEEATQDMILFNEGIDQALAESIITYTARSERTRDLFLAILGHDLRAPLATLTVTADLLARAGVPAAETQKAGERIRRSALFMSSMVSDLIGYTRIELGSGMPITLVSVDVGTVCRSAMEDAHCAFPESRFEMTSEGDLTGMFDDVRLRQLFTNLMVNAAKHGASGEPVRVRAVGETDVVRTTVNNQGPTIPRSAWNTIFQPLVQLHSDSGQLPDRETSLGLGLYVAKQIVTLHGGTIEVHSTKQEGTTFSVCLPRMPKVHP